MTPERRFKLANIGMGVAVFAAMAVSAALARSGPAEDVLPRLFGENCFSPFLTAAKAKTVFDGLRYDFYDLDPFRASNAPSPTTKAPATPGTDRRCELSFDGDHALAAAASVAGALDREGITQNAELPAQYQRSQGTVMLAARRLNPNKIAVVHVGTRQGPHGVETFMNVERLLKPAQQQAQDKVRLKHFPRALPSFDRSRVFTIKFLSSTQIFAKRIGENFA